MTTTLTGVRDQLVRAAYARSTALPPERTDHACFPVTVVGVHALTAHLRRLTLAAPELTTHAPLGPDEYFGLLMPRPGQPLPALPTSGLANIRAEVAALGAEVRPDLRWYTVRAHRPAVGEVDVDVMVHGDEGPGSAWVSTARVGDEAGFQTGAASYHAGLPLGTHLLVGDETASPALSAILEQQLPGVRLQVVLEVADRDWVPELPPARDAEVVVVHRGSGPLGSAALPAVRALGTERPSFAWICGEQTFAKEIRRHVRDLGVDRRNVYHCAYWIVGRPRG